MPARRVYPQRVQHGFQQLGGPPLDEFFPNNAVLFLTGIGGWIMLGAGVFAVVWGIRNFEEDVLELWWVPLILLGLGAYLAWRGWHLWGQELMVCPNGLLLRTGSEVRLCRWDDIKRVEQQKGKQVYEIVRKKGESWHLDPLHTPRIGKLEAALRAGCQDRKIPWTLVEKKEAE
ncbi:MAG: solute carrier family 23 protein [Gemmataceae bacterium]|nr:solute carrier family 23 protein [Gemmataceae bacterium]